MRPSETFCSAVTVQFLRLSIRVLYYQHEEGISPHFQLLGAEWAGGHRPTWLKSDCALGLIAMGSNSGSMRSVNMLICFWISNINDDDDDDDDDDDVDNSDDDNKFHTEQTAALIALHQMTASTHLTVEP